jgi:chromosome partitioning protein
MTITFSHQKGGIGKSTLTYHLAGAFRRLGKEPLLIDLDVQNTVTDLNQIRRISGHEPFRVLQCHNAKLLAQIVQESTNDVILIDTGGFDTDVNRAAIYLADLVVTPANDRLPELMGLKHYEKILNTISENTDEDIDTRVLINYAHPTASDFSRLVEFTENSQRFKMLDTVIRQRADFHRAFEDGSTVTEVTVFSKASQEILKLAEELIDIVEEGI